MFWKFLEFLSRILSRIIYARRIHHVGRVGKAATLASSDPDGALKMLDEMEHRIHPAVRSMHALTYGRILDGLERIGEAEAKIISAAKIDPSNMHAHLELARMSARKFQFKNAKERAERLAEEDDTDIKEKALALLKQLEDIASGRTAKRYAKRARILSKRAMGGHRKSPGIPADFGLIDEWIDAFPEEAAENVEDIALLFGESLVIDRNASWKISLSTHHSLVILESKQTICPFDVIKNRFTDSSLSLLKKYSSLTK